MKQCSRRGQLKPESEFHKNSSSKDGLKSDCKERICLCSNCHKEFHWQYDNLPEKPKEALEDYLGRLIDAI